MNTKDLKLRKIKVFEDDRGVVIFPVTPSMGETMRLGDLKDFHVATLKPGAVRGNHLHPDHDEYILSTGEGAVLVVRAKGEKAEIKVENSLVKIGKGIPHAIVNRGKGDIFVVCFYGPGKKKLARVRDEVIP